jgi:hypothetical protein
MKKSMQHNFFEELLAAYGRDVMLGLTPGSEYRILADVIDNVTRIMNVIGRLMGE